MFDKAENVARSLPADAWQCLSAGDGTKGPRRHDWAYVELAHLGADEYVEGAEELWTRGLLIRRHRTDSELAYFSTSCRHLDRSSCRGRGHRWSIEDAFETAKDELGLDHNETRSWHGWHRHVSLVMLAFAILAVTRHHANAIAEQTLPRLSSRRHELIRWSIQEIRRIATRLAQGCILPRPDVSDFPNGSSLGYGIYRRPLHLLI